MALVKASTAGTIKKLKSNLKAGNAGTFIKSIPKDDSITVRFLHEPEEWVQYAEYYVEGMEPPFFPDFEGLDPDVVAGARKPSKKYLACAVDRSNNEVIVIKMPKTLVESIMKKYDKFDTVLDRDYELMKDGEGLNTSYEAIPETPRRMRTEGFKMLDLMKVLESQIPAELRGDDADDDDDDDEPIISRKGRKRPVKRTMGKGTSTGLSKSGASRNGGGTRRRPRA